MNQKIPLLYLVLTITNFCLALGNDQRMSLKLNSSYSFVTQHNNTTENYNRTATATKIKPEHRRCRHHLKKHCWHSTKILKQSEATVIIKKCTTRAVTHHCPTPTVSSEPYEGILRHTQNIKTFDTPIATNTESKMSRSRDKGDSDHAVLSKDTATHSIIPTVTIILDQTVTKDYPDATYAAASLPKPTRTRGDNRNDVETTVSSNRASNSNTLDRKQDVNNANSNTQTSNTSNANSNTQTSNTSNANSNAQTSGTSNANSNTQTSNTSQNNETGDTFADGRDDVDSNIDDDVLDSDESEITEDQDDESSNDIESSEQDDDAYNSDNYEGTDSYDEDDKNNDEDDLSYSSTLLPSSTIQQTLPSQTSDPSIFGGNELSVSNSVSNKALGIGLGVGIGCVAALGLAGLLFHNKRRRLQESMVENSDIGTRWSPQNFRDVVASTVSNLPRSPSQRSRTSIGH
ncbi:hypothetical protein BY458DRAFT_574788 [Sporodiniella umbellata]|nr:hypothetical protein BY458DRAFT_574788 [Sporodiniella umbellata]